MDRSWAYFGGRANRFSNGLVVRSERKSGIKDDSTFWRVSNQKDEVVTE